MVAVAVVGSTDEVVAAVVETGREPEAGEEGGEVCHPKQQRRVMQMNQQRLPEAWRIGLGSVCFLIVAGILKYGWLKFPLVPRF